MKGRDAFHSAEPADAGKDDSVARGAAQPVSNQLSVHALLSLPSERKTMKLPQPEIVRGVTKPRRRADKVSVLRMPGLAVFWLGMLLTPFCLWRGYQADHAGTRPIEAIQPAQRVIVNAPPEALATDFARLTGRQVTWSASDGRLEVEGVADALRELQQRERLRPAPLDRPPPRLQPHRPGRAPLPRRHRRRPGA